VKILHLTDIHFNQSTFNWITSYQDNIDVICLTGDFLDHSINAFLEINEQISWINNWLKNITKPLFLCSGNHDVIEEDVNSLSLDDLFTTDEYTDLIPNNTLKWLSEISQKNVFTDGSVKEINGIIFGCMPYEMETFEKYKNCHVLLTHVPPATTDVAKGVYGDYGCELITTALKTMTITPNILLCGHIHNPLKNIVHFNNTCIYNPGYKLNKNKPNVIVISESHKC